VSQPSPLTGARQHAQALADAGDLGGARAVLQHAVDMGGANLGEDDPDVLATAHQLAQLHQRAGDPSAARRVLEEAYAAGQWRLGDADPLMLLISHDLGMVAEELGNRHEARRAFGRVASHGLAVLGGDHWAVARARAYLGEDPPTVRMELPVQAPAPIREPVEQVPPPHILPPPMVHVVSTPPGPYAVGPVGAGSAYARKGPALFAAIAAVLAAVIAVAALIVVLAQRGDRGGDSDAPALGGGPAPTDVRLRDAGTSVQVSWTDPANGTTSFIVSMGRPGEVLRPQAQVSPGATSFKLDGLNAGLDYCFAVVAVYSTKDFASSPQACTSRSKENTSRPKTKARPSTTG
jgi:hypothetical protein